MFPSIVILCFTIASQHVTDQGHKKDDDITDGEDFPMRGLVKRHSQPEQAAHNEEEDNQTIVSHVCKCHEGVVLPLLENG